MAKQPYIPTDPESLKPVLESMIFASEEPISVRTLIRILVGEAEDARIEPETPPLLAMIEVTDETAPGNEASGANDEVPAIEGDAPVGFEEEDTREESVEGEPNDLADAMERAESRLTGRRGRTVGETINQKYIRHLIELLNQEYEDSGRAFRIVEIAGGFQFATIREYGEWVALLSKEKQRRRLSPAALETLAIIAYRQPVSKPEIESIRGVNCDQVLLSLLEKNLIAITGRSEAVGRPLLYGTSEDFLRAFGLNSLVDLPKLREIEELMEEDAFSAERAEVITVEAGTDVEEIEARVGAAGHNEEEDGDAPEGTTVSEVAESATPVPTSETSVPADSEVVDVPGDASDGEPQAEPVDDLPTESIEAVAGAESPVSDDTEKLDG